MTTMRRRVLSLRLSDSEYQSLKQQAEQAGMSVPVLARRLALDSIQLAPRLEAIEQLIRAVPDRAGMVSAFQRLAEKIDRATTNKGVSP